MEAIFVVNVVAWDGEDTEEDVDTHAHIHEVYINF